MAKKKAPVALKPPTPTLEGIKNSISQRRRFTVFVPEGHDLEIKVTPEKEFLLMKSRVDNPQAVDATTGVDFVTAVNELLTAMPDSAAIALGKQYARLRGIRGEVSINEGYVVFASDKSMTVGLYDILKQLRDNRVKCPPVVNGKFVRKISKERKLY